MTHPPEREIGRELAGAMHHSTGSYELVVAAIAAAGLGFWIDNVVGTMPVFTLIFAVAGFIGAGYSIWIKYQSQMDTANQDRLARRNRTGADAETAPPSPATAAAKQAGKSS